MKRVIIFFLTVFMTIAAVGKNVPTKELLEYGKKAYLQRIVSDKPAVMTDVEFIASGEDTLMAIFNFDNNGFLVMSADDAANPVLAYSQESRLNLEDAAPATRYWIEIYKQQITAIKRAGNPATVQIAAAWEAIRQNSSNGAKSAVVEPIVSAKWDQSKYYNFYAPRDPASPAGYDGKVPAGCVAVAMAMIMYTLEYPATGTGTRTNYTDYGSFTANFGATTYRYGAMQDVLQNHNHEVAQLISHCATAVEMHYAPEGSGASSWTVAQVIQSYFKYNNTSYREKHGSEEYWSNLLKDELNNGFPIYYSGHSDEGGHAFVCDGYDSDNLFHFNFGWGGSGNGYYTLSDEDGVNSYNGGQGCVFFHPNNSNYPQFCSATAQVYDAVTGTVTDHSGNQNYQNSSNCTYLIAPPNVDRFTVNIVSLATEADVDTLTFWAGNPARGQRIATFSGIVANHSFTANTDSLYVTFRSNESITDAGWKFTYTSRQTSPTCAGIVISKNPSGTFSQAPYLANSNCIIAIDVTGAQWLKFSFSQLDLSPEDYIEIVSYSSQELYAQYSGSTIPQELLVNSRRARVNFISDNRVQRSGFALHWTSDLAAGIEEQTEHKLILFPNPATVQLQIMNMPIITEGDKIEIYNTLGQRKLLFLDFSTQTIDISSLSAGIYILKIGNYVGKFVKE